MRPAGHQRRDFLPVQPHNLKKVKSRIQKNNISSPPRVLKKIASTPGYHRKSLQVVWVDSTERFRRLNFFAEKFRIFPIRFSNRNPCVKKRTLTGFYQISIGPRFWLRWARKLVFGFFETSEPPFSSKKKICENYQFL